MWLFFVVFIMASADDSRFHRVVLKGLPPSFEGKNSNEYDTMLSPDVCAHLPVSRIVKMPPLESCPALMRKECLAVIEFHARRLVRARCRPVAALPIIPAGVPEVAATVESSPLMTLGSTHAIVLVIGGAIGVVGALVCSRRCKVSRRYRSHV